MKRNRWEILSVVGIMLMCLGTEMEIFSDLHPWTKALDLAISIPWIAGMSYLYGRTDGKRKQFRDDMEKPVSWAAGVTEKEIRGLTHIVKQRTTIRFKEADD